MTVTPTTGTPVTVIGLGPMGQAMVRVLIAQGHPVTVWNRTASRADDLVAAGAQRAETPEAALRASELVVLSLTHYQAMYNILGSTGEALEGRTLVNLSSDTPEETRKAAEWAGAHGARFLTGGIMVPEHMVGGEAAYVYYSGPREAFDSHEPVLRHLGRPHYVGADAGLAQLFYQAELAVFLTTLSGLLQGAAMVQAAGVSAADFVPQALGTIAAVPQMIEDVSPELDSRTYPGDQSTTEMMGATADHIVETAQALGIDARLPEAVQSHYARAITAGHAKANWTSLIEVIRRLES
jgi:3-hydroxyisobutyrate dehydrogenase-like beta-hydroxyacid dehydrogenase